jgi:hypothetical protein
VRPITNIINVLITKDFQLMIITICKKKLTLKTRLVIYIQAGAKGITMEYGEEKRIQKGTIVHTQLYKDMYAIGTASDWNKARRNVELGKLVQDSNLIRRS